MYAKINVGKPGGISPGAAAAKDPNVTIMDIEDILVFPPRNSSGIVHVGDFVMKEGKFPVQVYMTKSKISAPYASEGEEDNTSIKQSFEGQHPGNKREIREFIQNWMGKNVIIIHGSCSETEKEVVGTKCAPLQLKPEKQDNNDGRHHGLKFEAFAKSAYLPGLYQGVIPMYAPANVADATSIMFNAAVNEQYKLPSSDIVTAIDIEGVIAEDRQHFTLIGSGGSIPATLVGGTVFDPALVGTTFVLRGGSTWVALVDSTITFEFVRGGLKTYLVEISRT